MNNILGERISDLLQKNNLTKQELAERVGVTENVMSRYISGERTPIGPVIAIIAKTLNVDYEYLLEPEETKE